MKITITQWSPATAAMPGAPVTGMIHIFGLVHLDDALAIFPSIQPVMRVVRFSPNGIVVASRVGHDLPELKVGDELSVVGSSETDLI